MAITNKLIIQKGVLPEDRIVKFIQEHHVMALATSGKNNLPWCASCFYVYIPEHNWFVFTSDDNTRHGEEMLLNNEVAACIALETNITGKIRGVQIAGAVKKTDKSTKNIARSGFLKRFPVAIMKKTNLWILEPGMIKMTDNRLGFGVKLIWEKTDKKTGNQ